MENGEAPALEGVRRVAKTFILEEFLEGVDPSELTAATPLVTGGILDSIAMIRLVSNLEENFGVQFQPHELGPDYMDTLDLIAETVVAKLP